MKKSPIAFVMFFICGAYAATHLDTENRLWFNADIVKNAIVEFVPESKQQPTADLYQDLMNQTTGKISVDSLFKVCRKAGFNTYKYEGFTQCKSFIQKMLMDAEVAQSVDLNGFCPGLDEKGNNPNKLRSITDKTRIGDFCSSTNIRMGQVIFKPGYNCSCMASVCNPGFEFQGGACITKIAGHSGTCKRHAHPASSQNNSLEKCKAFCEQKYSGQMCQFMAVVYDEKQCICSPTDAEIDAAYNALQEKINNLDYYEVCKKKRNSGDVCDEDTFNWVNVGRLQASGLAEEYARVRYKDTIHCDTTNTRGTIDDYVKCSSLQQKKYYEFKFDDIKESVDSDIQAGVVLGICSIHNVKSNVVVAAIGDANRYTIAAVNNQIGVLGCKTACTSDITESARRMGLTATTEGKFCVLSGRSIKSKDTESKLAKIDGIDNYVFFHGIQIQGSQNIISQLRQYIKSTGKTVRTFDCNKNVGEIKNSLLAGDDDVLPCMLNGQPIDFVFEDFSESWLYVQEVGEGKIQCIVSGGKFAGQECYGLDEKQCTDANAKFLKQNPGASGFRWDGKECVSIDANEAQFYDGAIQVGTGTIALVDCVFGTKLGCVLVAVESASLVAEMGSGVAIENRAGDFLALATRCNDRNCAINILRNDASRVLSVKDVMDATSLNSVDQGLAHLVDKLEPEDLSGVSDGDWDAIVRQLGGDPEDASGTALVMLNKIGLIGQFASVGASGLRLTAQAITKLAGKGSRIGRTASTVARALDTSGDAARAANAASDASRAANNASDALHANIDAVRNASNKNRARAMYHPDRYATSSASIQSKAQDIFQKLDNIDNMSDDELRALSRLMSEFDAEVAAEAAAKATAAAADATRATTNATTDGARTTNATADAARTTSRATNAASDAGRTTNNTTDVTRGTNTTSDVAQATNATTDATRATTNATADAARTANATTDAARTTSRTTNTATDGTRMFGRTNLDDIGAYSKGWQQHAIDGDIRFKIKKITYPEEADDVRRALESGLSGSPDLAFLGVKDDYIYLTFKTDLKTTGPIFDNFIKGTARMFGRTNVNDIGKVNKGWERAVFDGVDRFRHKKITYPEEADDVRRALEATKGQHNLAYMGVKDGYIVIAYESDLERAWPAFNKAVSGMTDAARTTSRATNASADATRTATKADDVTAAQAKLRKYGFRFRDDKVKSADNITPTIDNAFKKTNGKFTDLSDEAGKIRIQAMKDKYGIHFQDGTGRIFLPDNIDDIMRQDLGNSQIEMQLWDDVRDFSRSYSGFDIGNFDDAVQSADNLGHALYTTSKTPVSVLASAKQKLVDLGHGVSDFDGLINDFVHNNGPFPGHFTRNTLTDSEFDELAQWFKSEHNLTLGVDDYGILKIERPTVATVDPVAAMKAKLRSGTKTSPLDLAKQTPTNNGGSARYKVMDDGTIVRETPEAVTTATKADDVAQVAKRTPLMDEYKLSQSDMDIVRSCDITFGDARYTLERVLENPRILDDLDDDITLIKEARKAKNFINNSDMGDDAYYEILHVLKRIEDIPVSGMRTKLQRIGYDVDDIANGNLDKTLTKWGLSPYDKTREINQQLNSVENMMNDLDTAFRPYSGGYDISDEVGDWVFAYRKEKEQVERYTDMLRQFNKIGYQPDFAHIPHNAIETLTARWDLPRHPTENDITWRMQDIEGTFRSYGDVVESSDAVYELQRQFRLEKEAAEKYIRHITGTY